MAPASQPRPFSPLGLTEHNQTEQNWGGGVGGRGLSADAW